MQISKVQEKKLAFKRYNCISFKFHHIFNHLEDKLLEKKIKRKFKSFNQYSL